MRTRRGGLLGIHAFKTMADNRRNCMTKYKSKKKQRIMCSDKMLSKFDYRRTGKVQRKKPMKMPFKIPFL